MPTVGLLLLPVLASGLLALFARRISAVIPPAIAAPGLTLAAVIAALSMGFSLSVLGFQLFAQLGPVAAVGHWSAAALESSDPLPTGVAGLAGFVAVFLMLTGVRQLWIAAVTMRSASGVCRRLGPDAGGLVVIQDDRADAFTVPGVPHGRIVISTSMLRALDPGERRALLAHEAAHLSRRHHVLLQLVDIAAAADPLLRPLRREVRISVERWADEYAARSVGDRHVVARALARAALARASSGSLLTAPAALAIADTALTRRVDALMATAPRRRLLPTALLGALVVALVATMLSTAGHIDARFDQASAVYELHEQTR